MSRYGERIAEMSSKAEHLGCLVESLYKKVGSSLRDSRTESLLCIHSPPIIMGSSQPFIPVLKDIPPPSRGLSSSIWAPQPHPTEASWQKAITSFSQSAEEKVKSMPDDRRGPSTFGRPDREEDAFGPVDFFQADHKKSIGAIGDGRKKTSPDTANNVGSTLYSHTATGL
jgi:hypothetical protein